MRALGLLVILSIAAACSGSSRPAPSGTTSGGPALVEIPRAPDQPVGKLAKTTTPVAGDLAAIVERGYLRILAAPSRAHFETIDGQHRGRAVDAGVALARKLSERAARDIAPVFIEAREEQSPACCSAVSQIARYQRTRLAHDKIIGDKGLCCVPRSFP